MTTADQLKALVRSHRDGDENQFYAVALQLAASEARRGHGRLAEEIRQLVETGRARGSVSKGPTAIHQPKGDLAALLSASYPEDRLSSLVTSEQLESQLVRVIREQRNVNALLEHGLSPRRRLLFVGPPGSGKTLTASVLAGELGLPLFLIRLDVLFTRYMGEAAARLRQIFDAVSAVRGVYFFDEFDAIGSQRGMPNDIGEARRILNSFLQMLEQDASTSLILAATNHPDVLDRALLRRFDDVLKYQPPNASQAAELLRQKLSGRVSAKISYAKLAIQADGLSYAEIAKAADDAMKEAIIEGDGRVSPKHIAMMLAERKLIHDSWKQVI
jgi:SpoVK/Ycf46/Vps4 family AAA+-type ATPase